MTFATRMTHLSVQWLRLPAGKHGSKHPPCHGQCPQPARTQLVDTVQNKQEDVQLSYNIGLSVRL